MAQRAQLGSLVPLARCLWAPLDYEPQTSTASSQWPPVGHTQATLNTVSSSDAKLLAGRPRLHQNAALKHRKRPKEAPNERLHQSGSSTTVFDSTFLICSNSCASSKNENSQHCSGRKWIAGRPSWRTGSGRFCATLAAAVLLWGPISGGLKVCLSVLQSCSAQTVLREWPNGDCVWD